METPKVRSVSGTAHATVESVILCLVVLESRVEYMYCRAACDLSSVIAIGSLNAFNAWNGLFYTRNDIQTELTIRRVKVI